MFDKVIIQQIANHLMRNQQTIAVAESVTAGYLQAALASAENASVFFQGGLTAYNIHQKYTHLHIDLAKAVQCNCVSGETAGEMALAVAKLFSADWGLSITGYASPIPAHPMKELYACYAIAFNGDLVGIQTITTNTKSFQDVQLEYIDRILKELLKTIIDIT